MTTCDFYLNTMGLYRVKTITGKFAQDCWITFIKDFGEVKSDLCKVKVTADKGTDHHYKQKDFLQLYVTPENR